MTRVVKLYKCPRCGGPIQSVGHSEWMTDDQYDAVKAGDFYCEKCPDNGRGASGLCYWWKHELPEPLDFQI